MKIERYHWHHYFGGIALLLLILQLLSGIFLTLFYLPELERAHIIRALEAVGGNQSQAARLLDITREKLRYRLRKYGIKSGRNRGL